jgi:hypothetical protein
MSKPALYKLTYALIMVHGYFTDAFTLGERYTPEQNARNSAHFRIFLPEGSEARFTELSGLSVSTPPRVQVGLGRPE